MSDKDVVKNEPGNYQLSLPNFQDFGFKRSSEIRKGLLATIPPIKVQREQKGYQKNEQWFAEQIGLFGNIHVRKVDIDTNTDISKRISSEWQKGKR